MKNKFEKLVEYIINDDQKRASALFHEIVVEKSRDIYEGLVDDELTSDRGVSRGGVDSLVDEIGADEEGLDEAGDDEEFEMGDDAEGELPMDDAGGEGGFDAEMDVDSELDDAEGDLDDVETDLDGIEGDELGDGEIGGEGEMEDRVMDLEDAIDELRAEFDSLMDAEAGEGHEGLEGDDEFGGDDLGGEEDLEGGDEFGGEEELGGDMDSDLDVDGEEDLDDEEPKFPPVGESKHRRTAGETMREYVEKVTIPSNKSEGGEVGAGKSQSINTKSLVAGKNDMGGSAKNIAKGSTESVPDGTSPKDPGSYVKKGQGKLPGADQFLNVPGGKKMFGSKEKGTTKEEGGVNKTTILPK